MIESAAFKSGFKKGLSTHSNLVEVLEVRAEDIGRRKSGMRTLLGIDLSKAYDKVKRDKLFEVLISRAHKDAEKMTTLLIERMYTGQKMFIGEKSFDVNIGVA